MVDLKTKTNLFNNSLQPLVINLISSSVTNGTGSATFDNPIPEDEFGPVPDPTDPTPDPGDPTINVTTICIDCVDPPPGAKSIGPILVDESGSYYPPIDLPETASVVINGKYRWVFEGYFEPTVDFDESKIYYIYNSGGPVLAAPLASPTLPDVYALGLDAFDSPLSGYAKPRQPGINLSSVNSDVRLQSSFCTSYSGDIFCAGLPFYDYEKGGVWVWEYNWVSDKWIETKLPDPPGLEDFQNFGAAIAINQTGDVIAVASPRYLPGAAYKVDALLNNGLALPDWPGFSIEIVAGVLAVPGPNTINSNRTGYGTYAALTTSGSEIYWDRNGVYYNDPSSFMQTSTLFAGSGYPVGSVQDLYNQHKDKKQLISIYKKSYNSGFDNPVWSHVQDIEMSGTLEQIALAQEPRFLFEQDIFEIVLGRREPLYFGLDNSLYVRMKKDILSGPKYHYFADVLADFVNNGNTSTTINGIPIGEYFDFSTSGLKFDYSIQNGTYEPSSPITYEEIEEKIQQDYYTLGFEDATDPGQCEEVAISIYKPWALKKEIIKENGKIVFQRQEEHLSYIGFTIPDPADDLGRPLIRKYSGLKNLFIASDQSSPSRPLDYYPLNFTLPNQQNYFPVVAEVREDLIQLQKSFTTCEDAVAAEASLGGSWGGIGGFPPWDNYLTYSVGSNIDPWLTTDIGYWPSGSFNDFYDPPDVPFFRIYGLRNFQYATPYPRVKFRVYKKKLFV